MQPEQAGGGLVERGYGLSGSLLQGCGRERGPGATLQQRRSTQAAATMKLDARVGRNPGVLFCC
jgi:hypothetical protein